MMAHASPIKSASRPTSHSAMPRRIQYLRRLSGGHLDGRIVYIWHAVDVEGEVLDVLVQATVSL
jgi:hypothetical protein